MKIQFLRQSLLPICAVVAVFGSVCFGNGPAQYHAPASPHQKCDCPKGGKHCGYDPIPKPTFWDHCKPHAPPFLPVIQSMAVRSLPPLTDASQMQLRVEMQQAPPAAPPDADQNNRPPAGGKPIQKSNPHQKYGMQSQASPPQSEVADAAYSDERIRRLENQVELLLKKLDKVLEYETRHAQTIDPQVVR